MALFFHSDDVDNSIVALSKDQAIDQGGTKHPG